MSHCCWLEWLLHVEGYLSVPFHSGPLTHRVDWPVSVLAPGKRLCWSTSLDGQFRGRPQLYEAEWRHHAQRVLLGISYRWRCPLPLCMQTQPHSGLEARCALVFTCFGQCSQSVCPYNDRKSCRHFGIRTHYCQCLQLTGDAYYFLRQLHAHSHYS